MLFRPPLPKWLDPNRDMTHATKSQKRSYEYWTQIYWATPPWLNEEQYNEMKYICESAKEGEEVDHKVPLKSSLVCGLNVPWNLEILESGPNLVKSNHMWKDSPLEPLELFNGEEL